MDSKETGTPKNSLHFQISTDGKLKIIQDEKLEILIGVETIDYMIWLYKDWQQSEFNETWMPEFAFDGSTYVRRREKEIKSRQNAAV